MPSVYVVNRKTKAGADRFRVLFTLGGSEARPNYGGVFKTRAEADERVALVKRELAAGRVPELTPKRPRKADLDAKQRFVYVISRSGRTKVGKAMNVESRRRAAERAAGEPVAIEHVVDLGDGVTAGMVELEALRTLRPLFPVTLSHGISREWFSCSVERAIAEVEDARLRVLGSFAWTPR